MNETQLRSADESGSARSLDERFAGHPRVLQRLREIAEEMERANSPGCTGDQVEEMTIEQLQKLGADMLDDWAQARSAQSLLDARQQHPEAITDGKKNFTGKRPSVR